LITSLFCPCFEVIFRPEEPVMEACFAESYAGFAGFLSRKSDRWMM
jgi:hypothetical protein